MENLNRIKGALADAGKTGVWLAGQLGTDPERFPSGVQTPHNPICRRWQRFRIC